MYRLLYSHLVVLHLIESYWEQRAACLETYKGEQIALHLQATHSKAGKRAAVLTNILDPVELTRIGQYYYGNVKHVYSVALLYRDTRTRLCEKV
jgi:hypothetical protein